MELYSIDRCQNLSDTILLSQELAGLIAIDAVTVVRIEDPI